MGQIIEPIHLTDDLSSELDLYGIDINDYRVQTTRFRTVFKIINLKNKVRYVSSTYLLREKKRLWDNIKFDKLYHHEVFKNDGLKFPKDSFYMNDILINEIHDMFTVMELLYPHILKIELEE